MEINPITARSFAEEWIGAWNETLTGADSVVLYYTSVNNKKAAELMQFDQSGKINLVKTHYND